MSRIKIEETKPITLNNLSVNPRLNENEKEEKEIINLPEIKEQPIREERNENRTEKEKEELIKNIPPYKPFEDDELENLNNLNETPLPNNLNGTPLREEEQINHKLFGVIKKNNSRLGENLYLNGNPLRNGKNNNLGLYAIGAGIVATVVSRLI